MEKSFELEPQFENYNSYKLNQSFSKSMGKRWKWVIFWEV
jgi:hypothetical protein